MRILWLLVGILIMNSTLSMASVWYVDISNASGFEDGMSWQTAYTTIQPAIDAAHVDGGGEVWIAKGIYNELRVGTFSSPTPITNAGALVIKVGIKLYGGFSGIESQFEERTPQKHITVIDGSTSRQGEPAYSVIIAEDNVEIEGLTIQGGVAKYKASQLKGGGGGGLFAILANVKVSNCVFMNNTAFSGGAIALDDGSVQITDCIFTNNISESYGGSIREYHDASIAVKRCIFIDNQAHLGGGAISASYLHIEDTLFENCIALNAGGGACDGGTGQIFRCVFRGNSAPVGGSLYFYGSCTLINCLFDNNTANEQGGAINAYSSFSTYYEDWTGTHRIDHCTFINNQAPEGPVIYLVGKMRLQNDLMPDAGDEPIKAVGQEVSGWGLVPSSLNISGVLYEDPHFADPEHGDYRLMPDSPAIDANGLDTGAPEFYTPDLGGTTRPIGANWDLGAYEYDPAADSDRDGLTNDIEWNTYHTHPYKADTDGDYVSDGLEIQYGTDPLDPSSTPPILPLAAGAALTGLLLAALWRARRMSR